MSRKFEILEDEDVSFDQQGKEVPSAKKIDFEDFDLGTSKGQIGSGQAKSSTGYVPPVGYGSPPPIGSPVSAGGYVPPATFNTPQSTFGAGTAIPMKDYSNPPSDRSEQFFGQSSAVPVESIIPPKEVPPARFWEPQYYQFLFNVDTRDVVIRILRSFLPFPNEFFSIIEPNPDLYGPFWIASTLIFVLAAVGNLTKWINSVFNPVISGSDIIWTYDNAKLGISSGVIYGYLAIIPLVVWGFCKYFKIPLSWPSVVCIYGYSFFVFIPVTVICVAPFKLLHWLAIGFATLMSTLFLLFNFFPIFRPHLGPGLIMLAIIGVLQAGFGIFQIFFFV